LKKHFNKATTTTKKSNEKTGANLLLLISPFLFAQIPHFSHLIRFAYCFHGNNNNRTPKWKFRIWQYYAPGYMISIPLPSPYIINNIKFETGSLVFNANHEDEVTCVSFALILCNLLFSKISLSFCKQVSRIELRKQIIAIWNWFFAFHF